MSLQRMICLLAVGLTALATAPQAVAKDGQLDRNFGLNGTAVAPVNLAGARFFSEVNVYAAHAPGGGTLVAGGLLDYDKIVHFPPDGRLDRSFGKAGYLTIGAPEPYPGRGFELAGMAVDPEGRIVVAGTLDGKAEILRFTSAGVPDSAFGGGDGQIDTDLGVPVSKEGTRSLRVGALAVDPAGDILLAGFYFKEYGGKYDLPISGSYLARLTASGEIDTTFGSGGLALETPEEASSILVEREGRIAVVGGSIARFSPYGLPDDSFGESGHAFAAAFLHIAVDSDGRILAAHTALSPSEGGGRIEVSRLLPDGTVDPSYGRHGVATVPIPGVRSKARGIAIAPDGSALITGAEVRHRRVERQGRQRVVLARFEADGSLDRHFGRNGIARASFGNGPHAVGDQVLLDGRKHALVAGTVESGKLVGGEGLALHRFDLK
jgi:uncharacterized delta-60 repeat protein